MESTITRTVSIIQNNIIIATGQDEATKTPYRHTPNTIIVDWHAMTFAYDIDGEEFEATHIGAIIDSNDSDGNTTTYYVKADTNNPNTLDLDSSEGTINFDVQKFAEQKDNNGNQKAIDLLWEVHQTLDEGHPREVVMDYIIELIENLEEEMREDNERHYTCKEIEEMEQATEDFFNAPF